MIGYGWLIFWWDLDINDIIYIWCWTHIDPGCEAVLCARSRNRWAKALLVRCIWSRTGGMWWIPRGVEVSVVEDTGGPKQSQTGRGHRTKEKAKRTDGSDLWWCFSLRFDTFGIYDFYNICHCHAVFFGDGFLDCLTFRVLTRGSRL